MAGRSGARVGTRPRRPGGPSHRPHADGRGQLPAQPDRVPARAEFIHELSALSDRRDFVVFSDEVYRGLELDSRDRLPAFVDVNERAVSLGVMSKTYGLAGLRIGWVATRDDRLFRELAAFKDYTTICNGAPSEFLATLALRNAGTIAQRNLRIIGDNLDRLDGFFGSHQGLFHWDRPKADPSRSRGCCEAWSTDSAPTWWRRQESCSCRGPSTGTDPTRSESALVAGTCRRRSRSWRSTWGRHGAGDR